MLISELESLNQAKCLIDAATHGIIVDLHRAQFTQAIDDEDAIDVDVQAEQLDETQSQQDPETR